MKHFTLLLSILFFVLAGIILFKDNPQEKSPAEVIQFIRFYGTMFFAVIFLVGFIILNELKSNK